MLVLETAVARGSGLERRLLDRDGDVEEREHDLLADRVAELLEENVPLAAVLDERVLLRERAQVDALAQVVHRLEVLAPALVDDLQDHVALDLARELGAERLLALLVRLERVLDELLGERLAARDVDLLAQLVGRDVASRRATACA